MKASFRAALLLAALALPPSAPARPAQSSHRLPAAASAGLPVVAARVLRSFPHDSRAFTQGLFFSDGRLFESTGRYGRSTLREVDLATGAVRRSVALPPDVFGEGATAWGREVVSLSWTNGVGFRWDRDSFAPRGRFTYPGEGWGLTAGARELILSDGSASLRFLDPVTFRERRRVQVTIGGRPLDQLNELEWVNGEVLANIWHQKLIARIDPRTGTVRGFIDLAPVVAQVAVSDPESVPNGIAFDARSGRLFVTGKNWPKLFEIAPPAR